MDDEPLKPRGFTGEGVGFVKDARDEYPGHTPRHHLPGTKLRGFAHALQAERTAPLASQPLCAYKTTGGRFADPETDHRAVGAADAWYRRAAARPARGR